MRPAAVALAITQLPLSMISQEIALGELRVSLPRDPWSRAAELVDWDGDGDLDVLRSSIPATGAMRAELMPEVQLLVNDGRGVLELKSQVDAWSDDFALGDFDGDGHVDGVAAAGLDLAVLLRNDGQGGLVSGGPLLAAGPSFAYGLEVATADVDADGDPDVFLRESCCAVTLLRNRGNAVFDAEFLFDAGYGGGLEVADLDGDGDPDLAVSVPGGNGGVVSLRFDDGAGGYADEKIVAEGEPLALAELDQSGLPDLVVTNGSEVIVLLNTGGRSFVESARLTDYSRAAELVDVDADGKPDLCTGMGLYLNKGQGRFEAAPQLFPANTGADQVVSGDLDVDGDVDLLLEPGDRLLLQRRGGAFRAIDAELATSSPVTADLDGDGDLDAIVSPEFGAEFLFLANDGRGEFRAREGTLPGNRLGDFDDDGDPDIVQFSMSAVGIALNDGEGRFTAPMTTCPLSTSFTDAAVGDLDRDGTLDLYFTRAAWGGCYEGICYAPSNDRLWLNDGNMCFADASASLPPFSGVGLAVELGDLELDGDVDIVTGAPHVVLNEGGGRFSALTLTSAAYAEDVALGDFDGDLLPDAYFASRYGDWILRSPAGGSGALLPTPGSGFRVGLADLDGDADLDVLESTVLTTTLRGPIEVHLNVLQNDSGSFRAVRMPRAQGGDFALGDFDQDGDTDVFDGSRVFHGLARSLSSRGPTRIGRPVALDLTGPPSGAWALLAATSLAPRMGPFGLRWLDPRTRLLHASGLLDVDGKARISFDVPLDPALVGAQLHWQALTAMPLRWSNFETTTVTGG